MIKKSPIMFLGILFAAFGGIFIVIGLLVGRLASFDGESWIFTMVFGLIGGVFFLLGMAFCIAAGSKKRLGERLMSIETPVKGHILGAYPNYSISVNGRFPFVLRCTVNDSVNREVHEYHSENLWYDPTPYIKGDTVDVYIDRGNPRRYYVDVASAVGDCQYVIH